MTDPIARYAATKDAEAFAVLVQEYQSMVLATCRRRVRTPGDVEDAVQETFLRLARGAGGVRSNVGAWLHRCATNVAVDLNRRGEVRRRHETAAALLQSADTTGRGIEDVRRELTELREHLDAALLKLDEPTRELIVQRYFVGRAQVDLARAAGVTPAAISQRLERAVDLLRQQLNGLGAPALAVASAAGVASLLAAEQASAAAVSAALTAKLNAIGLSAPVSAAIAAGTAITGGTALWACVAAAVLAIGVGVAVLFLRPGATGAVAGMPPATRPVAATPVVQPPPSSPAGGASAVTIRPAANGPAAPNWQAPATPQTGVLVGRVTDSAGNPVAGAEVVLTGPDDQTTTTDAAGQYRFATVRGDGEYHVGLTAKGFIPISDFGMDRGEDLPLSLKRTAQAQRNIVLQRAVPVNVTVVDAGGEALEDVQVYTYCIGDRQSFDFGGTSEQDGIFTVSLPPTGVAYALIARCKNRPPAFVTVTPKTPGEPITATITMDVGITVKGTALGSDGKPPTGWGVYSLPTGWPDQNTRGEPAKIDAAGHFTLTNIAPGSHQLWLSMKNSDRPLGTYELKADQPLNLKLPIAAPQSLVKVTGMIQWEGRPSAANEIQVEMTNLNANDSFYSSLIRYDPGQPRKQPFTLPDVPPGEYRMRFQDTSIEPVTLARVKVPGPLPLVTLKVVRKGVISGTVTDAATGRPVTNFALRLRKSKSIGEGPNYTPSTDWVQVSDPAGHYRAELVGPGEYQVQISTAGYAWQWSAAARSEKPGQDVVADVKLTTGGNLGGLVRDGRGRPVAGAKVIPLSKAQLAEREWEDQTLVRFDGDAGAVTTDTAGRYTLEHLTPGGESIRVVHPDFAPQRVDGLTIADGQTAAAGDVTLLDGGSVDGTVYNSAGTPFAGIAVNFMDTYAYNGDERAGRVARTVTDDSGHYHVDHLPQQTLYADLADDWASDGVTRRVVRPIEGKTARLDFGGKTPLTGRYLFNGQPKASVRLTLSSGDRSFGMVMAMITADADGRFTFRGVPAGRYHLFADIGREKLPLREVTVTEAAQDLGAVLDDRGPVRLKIDAADPADAAAIERIELALKTNAIDLVRSIDAFHRDGDAWVCDDVPAGDTLIQVIGPDDQNAHLALHRAVGAPEMNLTLPLPKRSATVHLLPRSGPALRYDRLSTLLDADNEPNGSIGTPTATTLTLVPGTYRLGNLLTHKPRPDSPPIVLKAGETIDVTPPSDTSDKHDLCVLMLWSSNGELLTDTSVTLIDQANQQVPAELPFGFETKEYFATPGNYTLQVMRPQQAVFARPFHLSDTANRERELNVIVHDPERPKRP